MFLSVIIPVYNTEPYLRRCIESVVAQDMGDEIELLLIDDGSKDGSGNICDEYSLKYDWIHTFHIVNSGVGYARNYGLERIKGEYFTFIDSDDFIDLGIYRTVLSMHKEFSSDLYVFGYKDYPAEVGGLHGLKRQVCTDNSPLTQLYLDMKQNYLMYSVFNKIFKSNDNNELRFITGLHYFEDYLFTLSCLQNVKTIGVVDSIAYNYVHHQGEHLGSKHTDPEVVVGVSRELKRLSDLLPQSSALTKCTILEYYNNLLHAIDCCRNMKQKKKYIHVLLDEIERYGYKSEFKMFLGRRRFLLLFPTVHGMLIMCYLRIILLKFL